MHTRLPRPRTLLATLPVLLLVLTGLSPAQASSRSAEFRTELEPVNQDGDGDVQLVQRGTKLTVQLQARDLDGGLHIAHIHGVRQANNECPTLALDGDGNGLVDLIEGLPAYGPVQRTLSQAGDRGTSLDYTRTYTHLDNGDGIASLGDLDRYAIVVHGVDLDGDGAATNTNVQGDSTADHDDNEVSMPALCGTIED